MFEETMDMAAEIKYWFIRQLVCRFRGRARIPEDVLKAMNMDTSRWD